jgi:hypothetical protein
MLDDTREAKVSPASATIGRPPQARVTCGRVRSGRKAIKAEIGVTRSSKEFGNRHPWGEYDPLLLDALVGGKRKKRVLGLGIKLQQPQN